MKEITVSDLKQILTNALEILEDSEDDALVNVSPNTYGLYGDYVSIAGTGFISLNDPLGEEEDY